jgi:hypothetical protein
VELDAHAVQPGVNGVILKHFRHKNVSKYSFAETKMHHIFSCMQFGNGSLKKPASVPYIRTW